MTAKYLRPLDVGRDAEDLHAALGDEASCLYMPRPATSSVEETRSQLVQWTLGEGVHSWSIVHEHDHRALGRVSLFPSRGGQVMEAAVMVVPEARRKGLARRAMAEALDFAFDQLNARRVEADVDPDNAACLLLFERLGFQREGHLRAKWQTHIGVRDTVMLAMLSSDERHWT
ncbi:MAG: GNAT family protein [Myxococcota bacterium]